MFNQFVSKQLKRLRLSSHGWSEENLKDFAADLYGNLGYTIMTEVNKTLPVYVVGARGRFVLFALSKHKSSDGTYKTCLFLRNGSLLERDCCINGNDLTLAE